MITEEINIKFAYTICNNGVCLKCMWKLWYINANSLKRMNKKENICLCNFSRKRRERESERAKEDERDRKKRIRKTSTFYPIISCLSFALSISLQALPRKKNEQRLQFVNNSKRDSQLAKNCFDSNT